VATDKTDEEQIESIKKWLSENGMSLVVGIALALGGVFGYQAWQGSVRASGEKASSLYQELVDAVSVSPIEKLSEDQLSTGKFIADQLKSEYEDTTYGHFAAMFMAKVDVEQNDLSGAESELRWILDHDVEDSIGMIVRQRLARVLLSEDKPEEALKVVEEADDPGAYASTYEEVKGDIYMKLGRTNEARQAYQKALDTTVDDATKPILKMKLENLAPPTTIVAGNEATGDQSDSKKPEAE